MRDRSIIFYGNEDWTCSEIRGRQVAERGGWLWNEEEIRPDDVLVFIKSYPGEEMWSAIQESPIYVDMVDCYGVIPFLREVPRATVITMSRLAISYVRSRCENEVIFIPEHHCNFEHERLTKRTKLRRIGYIGYEWNFQLDANVVKETLAKLGVEFVMQTSFKTRRDVIDFYRTIDVQLCYRLPGTPHTLVPQLKNPLKLANASSFGIPTMCFPEPCYIDEWDGFFFPIGSLDGIVHWVTEIQKDWSVWEKMSEGCREVAKLYHIDNIIKRYGRLLLCNSETEESVGSYQTGRSESARLLALRG